MAACCGLEVPRVGRENFDESREFLLGLPKGTESRFFERFGATGERNGGRGMYVDDVGDNLSKDLVNRKGSMGHDGGAGRGSYDRHELKACESLEVGRCKRWYR